MAWGRIKLDGMPFNQMILFPTEFKLVTTRDGLRMRATPIAEIEKLHRKPRSWLSLKISEANQQLSKAGSEPLHVRLNVTLEREEDLSILYQGNTIATIRSADMDNGRGSIEILIDKGIAEIFVNNGARYIATQIPTKTGGRGLELASGKNASAINSFQIFHMKSMWAARSSSQQ